MSSKSGHFQVETAVPLRYTVTGSSILYESSPEFCLFIPHLEISILITKPQVTFCDDTVECDSPSYSCLRSCACVHAETTSIKE